MKNALYFLWEIAKIVVIVMAVVVSVRYFLFQPFLVKGASMEPNFKNGDYVIVDELSYKFRQPQRGEVIVFKYPKDPSQRYIKRIIGLPGETLEIKDGKVFVLQNSQAKALDESSYLAESPTTPGNTKVTLDFNDYFVLGDNRGASSDSRSWGTLPEMDIIGRVLLRAFPFSDFAKFAAPDYQF